MVCRNPACLGNYDFEHISSYAVQRFVDGLSTIDLLVEAKTAKEVEEICLVCLLDVEDTKINDMELSCQNSVDCKVTNCREQLREIIEYKLQCRNNDLNLKKVL
ncbi:MAG: hypothetical protein ACC653_06295 [Gammaproteobacteria bacterium]